MSILGHNAVFRENVESNKCRVVYWSNLSEKGGEKLSDNQLSLPVPNMNNSIQLSLTLFRFNKFLFVYDLVTAFHQLLLSEEDTNEMHFFWYEDKANFNNYSIVAYKMKRVQFGMRFSIFLLMISLYVILILHAYTISASEISMQNMLFNLSYMDNLAFSAETAVELEEALVESKNIFESYGFKLQQFGTNCSTLKSESIECTDNTNLFGLNWNLSKDTYANKTTLLTAEAKTKRQVLSSINSIYHLLGLLIPFI